MTPQFRFPRSQLADWKAVCEIEPSALTKAIAEMRKLPPRPEHATEIQKKLSDALGVTPTSGEALLRQLLALHGMVRQLTLTPDELFKGLSASFQNLDGDWTKEDYERWAGISGLVREMFELEVVRLSAKALDLSYEHPELLQRARILTDIRPVFNSDASEICGTVISHSLMIRYDNIEGNHVINLSVDEKDIHELIRQCERALKKSMTTQEHLKKATNLPPIVPGKESNESV